MNKIWIAVLCCGFALPAMAHTETISSVAAKQELNNKVSQGVLLQEQRRRPVLPWVTAVKKEQYQTSRLSVLGSPVYGSWTTFYPQHSMSNQPKEQYELYTGVPSYKNPIPDQQKDLYIWSPEYRNWSASYEQRLSFAQRKERYELYKRMFQDLLDHHPVLAGYHFHATVPDMLADLSWDGYSFLSGFLQQPITELDADPNFLPTYSKLEDAVIKLEFEWTFGTKYILLVNTARKHVYFFTGEIVE